MSVFAHLQKLPLSYFQYNKIGDLMSRLTNDIHAVRELMGFGSLAIVDAVVVILFSLTLMIAIDPWLTLWSMMAMPFIPVVVRFFGRHIFRWSRDTQDQLSVMSAYTLENFSGIRVVQAYAQEENQIRGFDRISSEYRQEDHVAGDAVGDFLAADAGSRRHRRHHRALARRAPGVGGNHDSGRIRRFQRLSRDAYLAAHGDRLYRQSISARHRGAHAVSPKCWIRPVGARYASPADLRAGRGRARRH